MSRLYIVTWLTLTCLQNILCKMPGWMKHKQESRLPGDHLGGFHVLAILNSAAMNNGIHVSLSILVSSGYMPNSGIAESYGDVFLKDSPYHPP